MYFATRNTEGKGATMRRLVLGLATCSLAVAATASEPWPIRAVQLDLGRQMETVDYISCVGRSGRLVPVAVRAASGHVRDATNILTDDHYPAAFGHPDRTGTTFAKDGRPKFVGTLEVCLGASPGGRPGPAK